VGLGLCYGLSMMTTMLVMLLLGIGCGSSQGIFRAVSFLSVNFVIQEELEDRLVVASHVLSRGGEAA
jgi:hypothetical protein